MPRKMLPLISRIKKINLLIVCIHLSAVIFSQNISEELGFASYLIETSEYESAFYILKRANSSSEIHSQTQADSIHYLTAWCLYNAKKLDSANYFFEKVTSSSELYVKSKFFQAYCNIYLGKYEDAKKNMDYIQTSNDTDLYILKNFELAGIALLQREYNAFSGYSKNFSYNFYPAADEQENLNEYSKNLQSIKKKAPFLAGLFSAIIPGSGKFYAGYRGQAIAAFLPPALLATVAIENYLKLGAVHPQFIVFGAMFSVFYFGNIWGSALSVNTKRQELFYETDQNILLDLHLPLRRVFN